MNRSLPGTESLPGKVGRSNANAANSEFDEDDILASLLAPKTIHHEPSVRNDLEEDTRRNLRAVISARARALEAAAYGAAAYVAASSATCRLREFSESSDNDEGGVPLQESDAAPTHQTNASAPASASVAVNDAPNVGNDQQQNAATPVSGLANDNNPKPSPSSDGNTKAAEQPQYHLIGGRDAQEIMDPAACLFIANLDASRTQEGLQAEIVEVLFKRSQDAAVGLTPEELDASVHIYVKMVAGKDKKPYAFVQWMMPGIAEKMLKDIQKNRIYVSNRPIRAEWARASQSYTVARRDGGVTSVAEVQHLMKQFGQVNTAYHLNERAKKALDMPNGVFVVVETKDRRTNLAPILENHPVYVVKRWDRLLQLRGNFRSTAQKDFASEFEQDRRTVYLSGIIPEEVTSRHIEDIFVRAGSVINVQIIRRGPGPAFAYIEFESSISPDVAIQTFDNVELFHGCGPVRVERKKTQQPVGHASEQRIATAILRALGSWRPAVADNGNNNTVYQPMNALAPASHHSEIHHYRMPSSAPTVHSGLSVSHQASLAVSGPSNALAPRSFLPQGFQVRSASPSGAMTVASPRTPGRQSLVVAIVNETEGTSQILSRHILPSEVSPSSAGRQAPMTGDYNIAGHLGSPPERIVQGDTMYRQTPRGALLATSRSPGMDSQTA